MDVVELDRIAVHEAVRVVELTQDGGGDGGGGGGGDWERDSPCAGWTLRRLVAHMATQHYGFAAASRGAGGDPAYWRDPADMSEPAKVHRAAATTVLGAFAEPGVVEREFTLPELGGRFPGRLAVAFHFVDYVVHAWDVAATLGVDLDLPDEVLTAALAVARRVPAEPTGRGPGFAFAAALDVPTGSGPLEETLRLLGRSPERWSGRG